MVILIVSSNMRNISVIFSTNTCQNSILWEDKKLNDKYIYIYTYQELGENFHNSSNYIDMKYVVLFYVWNIFIWLFLSAIYYW